MSYIDSGQKDSDKQLPKFHQNLNSFWESSIMASSYLDMVIVLKPINGL